MTFFIDKCSFELPVVICTCMWYRQKVMIQISFAIFAFIFVQLVNAQDACTAAEMSLAANTACAAAFSNGTDADVICMGTCRYLFDYIISSCNATVSQVKLISYSIDYNI